MIYDDDKKEENGKTAAENKKISEGAGEGTTEGTEE